MKFAFDPPISEKITRMEQRLRWHDRLYQTRNIDRSQFHLADENQDNWEFSFLVVGDSGCDRQEKFNPQQQIARLMSQQQSDASFVLHTGDVVYEVGAKEYYLQNFILPYRDFIVGGEQAERIPYDRITFKTPFLPVLGNHDYYDFSLLGGVAAKVTQSLNLLKSSPAKLNLGWSGSDVGDVYARAFLDCADNLTPGEITQHLERNYNARFQNNFCLNYQPGSFTRLPNRYYSFRYGDIDFIALDSNTLNILTPIADTPEGDKLRQDALAKLDLLEVQIDEIKFQLQKLDLNNLRQQNLLQNYQSKLQLLREQQQNIQKKLQAESDAIDYEQLNWFKNKLIASWSDFSVRGRILYLHHSPYTTEATKYSLEETLAIRDRLRQVLGEVAQSLGDFTQNRPLLDLVIGGHAHCFEYLETLDTGYADSRIKWLVCGAGGHSVRRQRIEGNYVAENRFDRSQKIALSHLFLGCKGSGIYQKQSYSCLRIDVSSAATPQFTIRPLIIEQAYQNWYNYELDSLAIG